MTPRHATYTDDLRALADRVLLPGFAGTTAPDWVRRRLADGLAGVVVFSRNVRTPEQLATLTAALRAENPDILIGIDEEAGDVTRLEAHRGSSKPGNYALGVVDDLTLTEAVARDVGHDLAAVGVTLDFAPAADVNCNPDNPVIGLRAFGADSELVARNTAAWIRGLQSAGVAACAKHFPGHGDTSVDSHHAIPVVGSSRDEMLQTELVPFRAAISEGVCSIMTGHLLVPAYDSELPATLSSTILTQLLRNELGFEGAIITDGIEMAAVAGPYGIGGASARALAAGADAICVGGESADEAVVEHIRSAVADAVIDGRLPEERLLEAAGRVRVLASWCSSGPPPPPLNRADSEIGLAAARRAIRISQNNREVGPLPLRGPAHVVELTPEVNLAIEKGTPWGVGEPLTKMLPGTTVARLDARTAASGIATSLSAAEGLPVVIVVRDAHRHHWQLDALARLLEARPDAVVVEMGFPGRTDFGAVHIVTHGAARVCGQAAAEVLTGPAASR